MESYFILKKTELKFVRR